MNNKQTVVPTYRKMRSATFSLVVASVVLAFVVPDASGFRGGGGGGGFAGGGRMAGNSISGMDRGGDFGGGDFGNRGNINTGDINRGNVNIDNNVNVNVDHDYNNGWGGGYYHPVAAGVAIGAVAVTTAAVLGSYYYALPSTGCAQVLVTGVSYYQCGSAYYQQTWSGSNVVYVVVNP
ncbi:MAG: hypothetical protein EXR85_01865 [Xanthomonadales bacterium]|nr:hypothetical protein [Xanthomonadales bacterium]